MRIYIFSAVALIAISTITWFKFTPIHSDCTLIVNARIFDSDTATFNTDKKILLRKNKISMDESNLQECAIVDAKNRYVLPGLVDSHTHMLAYDGQRVSGWPAALELSSGRPEMTRIFRGEINLNSMLHSGFTTVRDLGNSGPFYDAKLKQLQSRKAFAGADLLYSGPGIAVLPTQINTQARIGEYSVVDQSTNIEKLLVKYHEQGAEWIKLYADNSGVKEPEMSAEVLKSITERAQKSGFRVAIHAEKKASILNALNAQPNSIEHFYEIPDVSPADSAQKPFVVLTDYSLGTCENLTSENSACVKKISDLKQRISWLKTHGFQLVFGSDAVLDFSSRFSSRGEAALSSLLSLQELGLNNTEIILAATRTAGLMLTKQIGKIAANYDADLVFYREDPLQNLHELKNPDTIISKGELICQSASECRL